MKQAPVLDDFEQAIAHTLRVKADQVVVDDDDAFRLDAPAPIRLRRRSPEAAAARHGGTRRILAVAATVAVLVGAAVVLGTDPSDDADVSTDPSVPFPGPAADETTVALVADMASEGWELADIYHLTSQPEPTTWQLFAVDAPSPLPRAVLVMSWIGPGVEEFGESPTIDDPTHTVRGGPARLGPPTEQPGVPPEALELDWVGGDVQYNAVAVGLTEDELLGFVESLQPRADAVTGFDAPAGTALPQLDEATTVGAGPDHMTTTHYRRPDGGGDLTITTRSVPLLDGGLLYRMVGEPRGGGYLVGGDAETSTSLRGLRPDGWEVEVGTYGAQPGPEWLAEIVDRVRPASYQDLVDLGTAQPVSTTAAVGSWAVEVHTTPYTTESSSNVAMCVTSAAGSRVCGLVDDGGSSPVDTASLIVDGEWIVVALSDGSVPTTIETASPVPGLSDPNYVPQTVEPEVTESNGQIVEVAVMPDDAQAMAVMTPGNLYAGVARRPSPAYPGG